MCVFVTVHTVTREITSTAIGEETVVVTGTGILLTALSSPVLIADTGSIAVEPGMSNTVVTVGRFRSVAAVTGWVADSDVSRAVLAAPVVFTDADTLLVLHGVWDTLNAVAWVWATAAIALRVARPAVG